MLRVAPDARETARDEEAVRRVVHAVLATAGLPAPVLAHPAAVAAAFAVQAGEDGERILRQAAIPTAPHRTGPVGQGQSPAPAAPAPHLARSVARALALVSAGADPCGGSRLTAWRRADRAVLDESLARLAAVWPEMLAELRICVAQVALLEGRAIDGFTDFATHGAIHVHRARLSASPLGLPGPVRFAEALVHEGTHTRCNAAQLGTPPLTSSADTADPVRTPLRSDPRPLTGLFQQTVVLARCTALYVRLLAEETEAATALAARRDRLADQARQAITALRAHSSMLTEHGLGTMEECDSLLRATTV
ncbi:HEXXH motif-containing putative peptide modification protein [Streptomyces sp. NPDC052101]|uniref:aKG-HExxH-type peptide beta-hydroxylase n=1 Tax=Streptomyces sp. NPDC052101 TaxID=3155763 RepID=UPI00344412A1